MPTRNDWTPVIGRIPVLSLSPEVDGGAWPAKAFDGEVVPFEATVFREGHDEIGVALLLLDPDGAQTEHRMTSTGPGLDRWRAVVRLGREGVWRFRVQAFGDDWATWRHAADIKVPAGVDVGVTLAIGAELLERAAADSRRPSAERRLLAAARDAISDEDATPAARLAAASVDDVTEALAERPITSIPTLSATREVRVERTLAGVASWYEYFPRSVGAERRPDGSWISGTFRSAAERLPEIAEAGFDVAYLPPIHPIGLAGRKGPNNTLTAGPHDPGSPYAIGSAEGGHLTVHPDLGTLADFRFFVAEAERAGLEVALDFALNVSPDHPWVTEHPEWFTTLPDGSIAFAENPPKKYQDIYPLNFDADVEGLRQAILEIILFWHEQGVRIFRVDNPHTKPVALWEWLIHEVNAVDPGVIFLAEAFTRPAMMNTLAKVGFQQSYSYFTWRNTKEELTEFLTTITTQTADFLKPNLFVNTPDILTDYLQFGGPAAFAIRATIAATASPLWGVYSGFELFENVARPGAEEANDNEKYEYRPRDYDAALAEGRSLWPHLARLNRIRREHASLRQLRGLTLHPTDDDGVLCFSKHLAGRFTDDGLDDTVIVVVNVDPHSVRETMVHLDTASFGIAPGSGFEVEDLITGARYAWTDHAYVRLDAFVQPAHILHVKETAR